MHSRFVSHSESGADSMKLSAEDCFVFKRRSLILLVFDIAGL